MNEEEKKAAAAAAEKKAAEEKAAADKEASDKAKEAEVKSLEDANKRIADLNKENETRRKNEKELKAKVDRLDKAFAILSGKDGETPDPAKLEKEQTDARIRDAYLKAAFVGQAREMHDADFAFDAVRADLSEVSVDVKTGKVDTAAIKTKLEEMKKSRPFLFVIKQQGSEGNTNEKKPDGHPDGNGQAKGGNPYKTWLDMSKTPGREAEANEYYQKNRAAIYANMPKG